MFSNLTLTSVFWIFLGLCLAGFGLYYGYSGRRMIFSVLPFTVGLISLGLGSIICGITNGFTDYSRNGRLLKKLGAILLLAGLALTVYGGWRFVNFRF